MRGHRWAFLLCLVLLSGCHWCQDETNLLILTLTGGTGIVGWGRAKWHHWRRHKNCGGHGKNVV